MAEQINVQQSVPQNVTPDVLTTSFLTVKFIIETYGWFILIIVSALFFLYHKYKPTYEKWRETQELLKEEEENKKNPDLSYNRQLKMEQARLRLQEKVSVDYAIRKEREAELAEQKRRLKIEEWEKHKEGRGYHSKSAIKPTQEPTDAKTLKSKRTNDYRPEFNPLGGGGGGSSGYRPSRRMNSGGG